jgi:hypothetical protein
VKNKVKEEEVKIRKREEVREDRNRKNQEIAPIEGMIGKVERTGKEEKKKKEGEKENYRERKIGV